MTHSPNHYPPANPHALFSFHLTLAPSSNANNFPFLQQAVDDVNANPAVLPGVVLEIVTGDSECREGVAVKAFVSAIGDTARPLHGVMTGCSSGSSAIAGLAPLYYIPGISGISSAGGLSDT